jgi:two-component system chemotaxis response regulator CheY
MRMLLSTALLEAGHTVELASDGVDGLTATEKAKFDLIITDLNMPRMNGLEFIKAFRAKNRFTPVLVLTTEANTTLKESAKAAGATGWVVKPFKVESFMATIARLLS